MEKLSKDLWIFKEPTETKVMISYEAKIKISKQDIEKIEEKLKQLGFQKEEERLERDIIVSSPKDEYYTFKLKEAKNNRSRILEVFSKSINEKAKYTTIVLVPEEEKEKGVFEWIIKKLWETLEREGSTDFVVTKIEKRRIAFNKGGEMSVTIDLDVIKKENDQATHLGSFIEITTYKEEDLDFLLQQFKDFGEITFTHYYKMENNFGKNIRD
jgi:adenylate cyclase class IV